MSPEHPLVHELHVRSPKAWDAEHPNLYRLELAFVVSGQIIESVERIIGFRTVNRAGNQLFVNGQPVKLHGVCRHSIHPLYGRAVPPEFDRGMRSSSAKPTSTLYGPHTTLQLKLFWKPVIATGSMSRKKQPSAGPLQAPRTPI